MLSKVLVIDDDPFVTEMLKEFLSEHYQVRVSLSGEKGIRRLQSFKPDVVLLDIRMPGMDGFETLRTIRKLNKHCKVIMITANRDTKSAVQSMKLGAYDYIEKPFDVDDVKMTIDRALETLELHGKVKALEDEIRKKYLLSDILTRSSSFESVLSMVEKVLHTDTTVLLQGESGCGKEFIARVIHYNSDRFGNPFAAVSVSALPATLVEAELFGYKKGSFTGATTDKVGKFEFAGEGTIFLDEISTLNQDTQVKLLRVLQEKEFTPLGDNRPVPLKARIIAATNESLEAAIAGGSFRKDLFYRLNVFPITIPPLRKRKDDIPLLAMKFLQDTCREHGRSLKGFEKGAIEILEKYNWPGNVRELENFIERLLVMTPSDSETISASQVEEVINFFNFTPNSKNILLNVGNSLENLERQAIIATLEKVGGTISQAAEMLGITRKTLREKMKRFGIYEK